MIVILLLLGAVLLVAALRNTQAQLATALEQDVPGFLTWALAIAAIGAVGFIPGARPISRGLLALVIVVIFVTRYQAILASIRGAAAPTQPAQAQATPSAIYTAEAGRGGQHSGLLNQLGLPSGASLLDVPFDIGTVAAGLL